ncbi:hypothetical protein B0H16DRAFT_1724041 [Mycena metata]|uniref:Secreted protein n=1 Tax=Mycena metata TaxID=1033252 RepID=A0AAD7N8V6_9AGAR|nr:hypothetical protein B0H16DRAFT_1724041 [Mycena metata]
MKPIATLSVTHLLTLTPLLRVIDITRALMTAIEAENSPWKNLLPLTIASYRCSPPKRTSSASRRYALRLISFSATSSYISVDASSSNGGPNMGLAIPK